MTATEFWGPAAEMKYLFYHTQAADFCILLSQSICPGVGTVTITATNHRHTRTVEMLQKVHSFLHNVHSRMWPAGRHGCVDDR